MKLLKYGGALVDDKEVKAIIKSVKDSAKSGNWQAGPEASKMEQEASKTLGLAYGVLTNSGSSAALLALSALELEKGSEVIISACTFPTIFNIILQCGLLPVVVDAKVGTYGFDVAEVEAAITEKTGAIIAIHPVGNPVDMPALMGVAQRHNLKVIEDCCDTWGGSIDGKMLGSFGDISFTSFHAAHIVSMGVGGGVFTNDETLAKNVRMYRDWGRQANVKEKLNGERWPSLPADYDSRFIYEKIGYNFQILELQAVMGRIQLKKAKKTKAIRKKNFDYLYDELAKHGDLILPTTVQGADVCWFAFPLTTKGDRGPLVAHLEKNCIETRSMFAGNITRHPAYLPDMYRIGSTLDGADYILEHSFWLSCHPRLSKADLKFIAKTFADYYAQTA